MMTKNDDGYAEQVAKNVWFTPKVIKMMDKIVMNRLIVREVIYPKKVPGCEIFTYNGCKRLYHNNDRFFVLEGERLNREAGKCCNLNADFFSAEKIVVQQRDGAAFDHWCNSDPFDLASLWPELQIVIVADYKSSQLIAFAPILIAHTPKFHPADYMNFVTEFEDYWKHMEKRLGEEKAKENFPFWQNSYNLLLWLIKHCCYTTTAVG